MNYNSQQDESDLDEVQETIEAERPSFKGTDGESVRRSLTASSSNYSNHNKKQLRGAVRNQALASNAEERNPFELKHATNISSNHDANNDGEADAINLADLRIPDNPSPHNNRL